MLTSLIQSVKCFFYFFIFFFRSRPIVPPAHQTATMCFCQEEVWEQISPKPGRSASAGRQDKRIVAAGEQACRTHFPVCEQSVRLLPIVSFSFWLKLVIQFLSNNSGMVVLTILLLSALSPLKLRTRFLFTLTAVIRSSSMKLL